MTVQKCKSAGGLWKGGKVRGGGTDTKGRGVALPRPSWLGGQGEALPLPASGARERQTRRLGRGPKYAGETPHSGVHKRPEAAAQSEAGEAPVRTGSGTIA